MTTTPSAGLQLSGPVRRRAEFFHHKDTETQSWTAPVYMTRLLCLLDESNRAARDAIATKEMEVVSAMRRAPREIAAAR
jgi:hypothetical protein